MTTEEFCIELMLMEHPGCTDTVFLSNEIKRILKEDVPPLVIGAYTDKRFIESEQLDRESRKIQYYTTSLDEIFNK